MSEKQEGSKSHSKKTAKGSTLGSIGILIITFALTVFVGAFAYGYFELSKVNMSLAKMVTDLRQQLMVNQQEVIKIQNALQSSQPANQADLLQQKTAASASAQQADMEKWRASEAAYLTRLANHQLELTRDAGAAYVLLQHAQEIMQKIPDPAVDAIRNALEANINDLQSYPQVNVEQIYQRLSAINNQLDTLPLPPTPLQYQEDSNIRNKDYSNAPWWKNVWHKTLNALRKIVIVRYNGANDMPLILPEEKMFLYQNMHAQMEAAMLSVMNRNPAIYQASMANLDAWIKKYFVQDAEATRNIQAQLQSLRAINLQPPAVNIVSTLQLFDQYLAQQPVQQPVVTQ